MNETQRVLDALRTYADAVLASSRATAAGEPESQLAPPVKNLVETLGAVFARRIVAVSESSVRGLGTPDFCIEDKGVLIGYMELKAPRKGADPENYRGHNRRQWERFRQLPNLIYSDGTEFGLYRSGSLVGDVLRFRAPVDRDGRRAITTDDAKRFQDFYARFLAWEPAALPERATARDVANLLAPLCRLLRDEVEEAVGSQAAGAQKPSKQQLRL